MLLFFFRPPLADGVEKIAILRSSSAAGPFEQIDIIPAKDGYENFVTHYADPVPSDTDIRHYCALFLSPTVAGSAAMKQVERSLVAQGETPLCVLPSEVLDTIQGIPMSRMEARHIQMLIRYWISIAETETQLLLFPRLIEREIYGSELFEKMFAVGANGQMGRPFRLRNAPVTAVSEIAYSIRGAINTTPIPLSDLDIVILGENKAKGTQRGAISVVPRHNTLSALFSSIGLGSSAWRYSVLVYVTYTAGFTSGLLPGDLKLAIIQGAAGDAMEIAGEAETAGLSSRSVDGYAESYTASATTTIFSARRIMYHTNFKNAMKRWKRLLFA